MGTRIHVGLAGYPVAHSLSPCMHHAVYEALGLDWEYTCYPCHDEQAFSELLAHAATPSSGFVGLNVTMPYKQNAHASADRIDGSTARIARAVNVLTFEPSEDASRVLIAGTNTDGAGVVQFLKTEAQLALSGISVVICGTGPTSASIIVELVLAGADSITVLGRERARVRSFCDRLSSMLRDIVPMATAETRQSPAPAAPSEAMAACRLEAATYTDNKEVEQALSGATLLIDATPVGMATGDLSVIPASLLESRHTVFDVVYGHGETHLIHEARARGAHAYDGLGMLVEQAALTIEAWTASQGISCVVSRALMRQAACSEIEKRSL